MRIIDGHIHVGEWSDVFLNYKTDVKQAIDVLKKAGVDSAVVLPCDTSQNEKLLQEIKNQTEYKFHFACWINPDIKDLKEFIRNNINDIKVFKFHPSFQKLRITDNKYKDYIDIAEENNIPIIVHCGRWKEIAGFEFPITLAKQRPNLNVILAHLGGDQPSLCTSCAKEVKNSGMKNIFLGTESVREFYFVNEVVKTVGAEKVIFGSDYNLGLPQMYIPIIESLNISNEEKELIFSGNISRLLNLD